MLEGLPEHENLLGYAAAPIKAKEQANLARLLGHV